MTNFQTYYKKFINALKHDILKNILISDCAIILYENPLYAEANRFGFKNSDLKKFVIDKK